MVSTWSQTILILLAALPAVSWAAQFGCTGGGCHPFEGSSCPCGTQDGAYISWVCCCECPRDPPGSALLPCSIDIKVYDDAAKSPTASGTCYGGYGTESQCVARAIQVYNQGKTVFGNGVFFPWNSKYQIFDTQTGVDAKYRNQKWRANLQVKADAITGDPGEQDVKTCTQKNGGNRHSIINCLLEVKDICKVLTITSQYVRDS